MTDSNNRLLSTLLVLQLSTLGVLIIILFNPPSSQSAATINHARAENTVAQAGPFVSPDYRQPVSPELKAALREVIRDELAALPSSTGAGTNTPTSQPDIMLSENELQQQETAAAISATVVQQATSAGVWTRADTDALLPYVARMSEQQRLALMDQLYGAINRQEMDMQDFPPL